MSETQLLKSMSSKELTRRMALWRKRNREREEAMEKTKRR